MQKLKKDKTLGAGLILMGGKARRLGGINKSHLRIDGMTYRDRVANVLSSWLSQVYCSLGVGQRISDEWERERAIIDPIDDGGPALSIAHALSYLEQKTEYAFLVTCPVDTPLVPTSFVEKLIEAYEAGGHSSTVIYAKGRQQNAHALWPLSKAAEIKQIVEEQGILKLAVIHEKIGSRRVDWPSAEEAGFLNVNTPDDVGFVQQIKDER